MKQLKKLTPITLQEQLYKEILNKIENKEYNPGDKIPTEFELAEMYNVSRVTVRGAIQQLVNQNKLEKKSGKGTFVKQATYTEVTCKGGSFTENCLKRNAKPSTKLIDSAIIKCSEEFKELADKENNILVIKRIRYVNEEPCIIEIDYMPTSFDFLLKDKSEKSFLKLIAKNTNMFPNEFIDMFQITYANKEYSKYLECPLRTPLLNVRQKIQANKKLVYMNDQYILTNKYIYVKTSE